jgi:hypothetical protein
MVESTPLQGLIIRVLKDPYGLLWFFGVKKKSIARFKECNYNLVINVRVRNKRTNLGKIYLENIYIIVVKSRNPNVTWFIKWKGTN